MADTVLVAQFHIQEMGLAADEVPTQISHILTESVRIGHMFNRTITLLWDCFMVCGLKTFIVRNKFRFSGSFSILSRVFHFILSFTIHLFFPQQLDWYDGPYFNHLLQQFQQSNQKYNDGIRHISKYRIYKKLALDNSACWFRFGFSILDYFHFFRRKNNFPNIKSNQKHRTR